MIMDFCKTNNIVTMFALQPQAFNNITALVVEIDPTGICWAIFVAKHAFFLANKQE